jgi:hypothetical protein
MRRLIRPLLEGPCDVGGVREGVIPKMTVIGFITGEDGLDIGPRRRSRTAERSGGYHADDEGASVGKSRM